MTAGVGDWQSGEGGTGWRRDSLGLVGVREWSRHSASGGMSLWQKLELGEEPEAKFRNSARRCGGFDLR